LNPAFVADASVAVSWVVAAQSSPATDRLLDHLNAGFDIVVPALWPYEVANSLLTLLRRGKFLAADYRAGRVLLAELRASVDHEGPELAGGR
jgi:hypothetical protein